MAGPWRLCTDGKHPTVRGGMQVQATGQHRAMQPIRTKPSEKGEGIDLSVCRSEVCAQDGKLQPRVVAQVG